MTNTLHRYGTAESFFDDYVVIAIPSKGNQNGGDPMPALRRFPLRAIFLVRVLLLLPVQLLVGRLEVLLHELERARGSVAGPYHGGAPKELGERRERGWVVRGGRLCHVRARERVPN